MLFFQRSLGLAFLSTIVLFVGCNNDSVIEGNGVQGGAADTGSGAADGADAESGGFLEIGTPEELSLLLTPSVRQVIDVQVGEPLPRLSFQTTRNAQPASANWSIDRGDLASLSSTGADAQLTPTGTLAGVVIVQAVDGQDTVRTEVEIKIKASSNGPDLADPGQQNQIPADEDALTSGGGPGGVGGEGLGTEVTDDLLINALANPENEGTAENLRFIYPYEGTIFPRGVLAPLVAWSWSLADAEAIQLSLRTESGSFSWTGQFGRPAILSETGGPFVQHPIPENIWQLASNSASGKEDRLIVALTVAQDGQAYGPIEARWTIAEARLSGTIYYNSYGTNLARNFTGAVGGDGRFGGATLGIKVGDTGPSLIAGQDGDRSYCRVCHSVSADGSALVSGTDNINTSFAYELNADGNIVETQMGTLAEFPAIYPDGSRVLTASAQLFELPEATTAVPDTGLPAIASSIGTPMFSADGKKLVINPMASTSIENPTQKLVVVDFDEAENLFSNPREVVDFTGEAADVRPGWGAFMPDANSLIFHQQLEAGVDGNATGDLYTRKNARAQLQWASIDQSSSVTSLNLLNGLNSDDESYLPALDAPVTLSCTGDGTIVGTTDTSHENDASLNYEPTVNPISGGGYAWVVFTSRRRYAHVATIPPFCSDPRGADLIENITPKKLWVAAVDLNPTPGTDPSHPAFYLPGQELLAGNSRGFWVLDPCRSDGDACATGDQCCNGFCNELSEGEGLVCGQSPVQSCSANSERCESSADCCDSSAACIGGFCAISIPR